jgi:carbonic anhydrase
MKKIKKLISSSLILALYPASILATSTAHWGYTGHGNPAEWGELSEKYRMCKDGQNQSPINIVVSDSKDTDLKDIAFSYKAKSNSIINNGHTIQVNIDNGSNLQIDGKTFELKQFHFHTPSENQIDGKNFPLEAHFVHLDKDNNIAVVALMFEDGAKNEALEKVWSKMPQKADKKTDLTLNTDDVNALLPKEKDYYRFSGSLTTPPCSEGVRWFVLKKPVSISKEQVEKFLHVMHHPNNRPIQNINARKILK